MAADTWLNQRNRRRAREAAEADRLATRVEAVAIDDLAAEYGPLLRAHGHGLVIPDRTEAERVRAIVDRDKAEDRRERMRRLAEMEVAEGVFVNLTDTVVEPTPEWMEKGDVVKFTPKQPNDTVRTIRTVRRVLTPIVKRMWLANRIDDEQFAACAWYRDQNDLAGLEGRWSSSRYGENTGGGGNASGPMAMHEREVAARYNLRRARMCIRTDLVKFFEAVVLHDLPVSSAKFHIRCRNNALDHNFRVAADNVSGYCEAAGIELKPLDKLLAG